MGLTVKDKAGTTTTSAISKGTITITDKENQKQDIEKLNRNTEDSLNKLKEIFDKTKVEERKQLLEELGIVGNRAIHEIASHNGWKDGSAERVAPWNAGSLTGGRAEGVYTVQSSGVQANVHLDFSTSRDHPVNCSNVSTSIIAVGGHRIYL